MKIYTLPSGQDVFLDDEDYERLKTYKYYLHKKGYAYRFESQNGRKKAIYMHHDVVGKEEGKVVDHINREKLDNRRENLRHISNRNNIVNSPKPKVKSTSIYKGVSWNKVAKGWHAHIRDNGKRRTLGLFSTEESAAIAYNEAVKKVFGEYGYLNDVPYDPNWESKQILNRRDGSGKSKYVGVSFQKQTGKWQSHITVNYKSIYLGSYTDEKEAARAYNEAAIKYRGDKAKLNNIE